MSRGATFFGLPDGTFVFGRPKAAGKPVFNIVQNAAGLGNNVLRGQRMRDNSRRYSKIIVVGQQQGDDLLGADEVNHILAIASDDRRYRIEIEAGAVALYDDQGQKVLLGRNNTMEITCTGTLTADVANDAHVTAGQSITVSAPLVRVEADEVQMEAGAVVIEAETSVTVTSPEVTVVAETKVTLDTPLVECTQDISVGGNLSVTGDIGAGGDVSDGTRSMALGREFYNSHYHSSTGSPPNPQQ